MAVSLLLTQKLNVSELNCDFYVFSGHKLYGPSGIRGILIHERKMV